jgi:tetratricopeptide (TPR) repeat protein
VAYNIHPAVAEIGAEQIAAETRSTIEAGLARIWTSRYQRAKGEEKAETGVQGDRKVVNDALKAAAYLMRLSQWNEAADVIEDVRYRDESPAVNERLIAYMQTITTGTSARYTRNFRIAASVLLNARRYDEARGFLEKVARNAKEDGHYSEASVALDEMVDMLHTLGRVDEAEVCLQDMKACTAAAGLGPWSQLIDAAWTLTLLHDRGRDTEVLAEFDRDLYPRMRALPEWKQQPSDPADSSSGRELLLDVARQAAVALRQWDRALDLSAEAQRSQEQRGAPFLELAELRINDAGPLIHLGRADEAAVVIADCRAQFEKDHVDKLIGVSFSALALLDAARGNLTAAVENASTALRFRYAEERPAPAACASAHLDLAAYLARSGTDPPSAAAHHYAAALIRLRILAGEDEARLGAILTDVPERALLCATPPPASFPAVCDMVERTTGVQFRKLFNALPSQRIPNGRAAYERLRAILADRTGPGT